MTETFSAYVDAATPISPSGTELVTLTVGATTFSTTVAQIAALLLGTSNTWTQAQTFSGGITTTTLTASGTVGGAGFLSFLASPPAIGGVLPNSGAFTTLSTTGAITSGTPAYTGSGLTAAQFTGTSTGNYYQVSIQNLSGVSGASADYVVTANNGNDTTHYVDFGINNSGGGAAPFTNANAGYVYSTDSELDFGALGAGGVINFYCGGGTATPALVGGFTTTGLNNTNIGTSTPGTGAFTTLSATGAVSGAGFTTYLASPPAIGGTAPNAGAFTTLTVNGTPVIGGTTTITSAINTALPDIGIGQIYGGTDTLGQSQAYYVGAGLTVDPDGSIGEDDTTDSLTNDAYPRLYVSGLPTISQYQLYGGTGSWGNAQGVFLGSGFGMATTPLGTPTLVITYTPDTELIKNWLS